MPVYCRLISSEREPSPDRQDSTEVWFRPAPLAPGQPVSCKDTVTLVLLSHVLWGKLPYTDIHTYTD